MLDTSITAEQVEFFEQNGYLVVPDLLLGSELAEVQREMLALTEYGAAEVRDDPDYAYGTGHVSGDKVLKRVEYVIDKSDAMKALLGHPFVLRSVERLQGADFVPTWDSMVLKLPGEGIIVPWHRDAGVGCVGDTPIFNVDFYLDEADEDTCVWVIPGSNHWSQEQVDEFLAARKDADVTLADFRATGAVPALMMPGDVLFHNILVLHGSPANASSKLRRVVYYEFRSAHVEEALGPHTPDYIPLKQKVLLKCLDHRKTANHILPGEKPFVYSPHPPYDTVRLGSGEELPTYRYAHSDYWRA